MEKGLGGHTVDKFPSNLTFELMQAGLLQILRASEFFSIVAK